MKLFWKERASAGERETSGPARLRRGLFHWGQLEPGRAGRLVQVTFNI
jgi:hypothetical protein